MTVESLLLFVALSGVALATPDATVPSTAGSPAAAREAGHVGLHAGLVLPQLGSELGTTGGVTLDAGYRLWRGLTPFFAASYAQPVVEGSYGDPRLTATSYTTTVTQRELTLTLGALWRQPLGTRAAIVGGAGARAWLLESVATGSAGDEPFLENTETSTRWGGVGLLGGELRLGPGALALTLELGGSALPHLITGDVATTALGVELGYRFLFR